MTHMEIADLLLCVANGNCFSETALRLARDLPWTTHNDRALLTRYLWGNEQSGDDTKLQDFALLTRYEGEVV